MTENPAGYATLLRKVSRAALESATGDETIIGDGTQWDRVVSYVPIERMAQQAELAGLRAELVEEFAQLDGTIFER